VVDTNDVTNTECFSKNIKLLKLYNFCLIVQHKNLEEAEKSPLLDQKFLKLKSLLLNVKSIPLSLQNFDLNLSAL
jgi:hypothetical protein